MADNERLQEIITRRAIWDADPIGAFPNINSPEWRAEQAELMWFGGQVPFLLKQIEQRDKTIAELRVKKNRLDNLTEGLAAEREQLITHKYDLLSVVEQMSGCIDAFIKDCKKHNMKIPHDVFFGSYTNLQSAYVQASDAIKKGNSV